METGAGVTSSGANLGACLQYFRLNSIGVSLDRAILYEAQQLFFCVQGRILHHFIL